MIHDVRLPRGVRPGRLPAEGARAPRLVDVDPAADEHLRARRVVAVGAGGIGGRIVDALARGGVRDLLVVDGAALKPESLLTHDCSPADVGRPKAAVAARRARALGLHRRVRYACRPFQELPWDLLAGADAVVLASDNLAAELAVGEACRRAGVRLVQASLHGPTLTAQVRSLANDDPDGPCLACGWATDDWTRLDDGTRFECLGGGAPARAEVPTRTTAELCALAAALAVAELRRRTFGLDLPPDLVVEWSGFQLGAVTSPLARSAACHADHARWRLVEDPDLPAATPRALLAAAGARALVESSFELEGCELVASRFVPLGARPASTAAEQPIWREVPAEALGDALDRPLCAPLGRPSSALVRVDGVPPTLYHPRAPRPAR